MTTVSVEPDAIPHSVAHQLGFHKLHMSHLLDVRHK